MPLIAAIAAIAVALTGLGGTALVAENSNPGDTLYPVKTEINEAVRSALSLTNKAKANWEVRKAERRLEEAEELILEGDNNALEKVEEKFNEHIARIEELKTNLEEKGKILDAVDVNSKLESSLSAHEKVLDRLRLKLNSEVEESLTKKIEELQITTQKLRQEGAKLEGSLNAANIQEAAEGKLKAVENKLKEVEKYLENKKEKLSEESLSMVQLKIEEAKRKIEEAKQLIEAESYREAFRSYQDVTRLLQEIKKLMVTERRLELKTKIEERIKERRDQNDEKIENDSENEDEDGEEENEDEDEDNEDSLNFESGSVQFRPAQ